MHIVQRGNNRQACFFHPTDRDFYLETLFACARRFHVNVHAYVLMTNHVHLLATPAKKWSVSRMMQLLNATYVANINAIYRRTGSLWEGRFKSSLVESERYCLACCRYIELNPVRAGMCVDPGGYQWSSYTVNALGQKHPEIIPHEQWLALGMDDTERCMHYRTLVHEGMNPEDDKTIRYGLRKGLPSGSPRFKAQIEKTLDRRLGDGHRGRPAKTHGKGL